MLRFICFSRIAVAKQVTILTWYLTWLLLSSWGHPPFTLLITASTVCIMLMHCWAKVVNLIAKSIPHSRAGNRMCRQTLRQLQSGKIRNVVYALLVLSDKSSLYMSPWPWVTSLVHQACSPVTANACWTFQTPSTAMQLSQTLAKVPQDLTRLKQE